MLYQLHIWCHLWLKGLIFTSALKVNVSDRLLRQNVLHRCRGGWIFSDVGRRKTCRTTSAGRCLSTQHHLFRWSCEHRRFATHFPHSDILVFWREAGSREREMLISICWVNAKSWTHSLESGTKLSVDSMQLKYSRFEKHIPVPGGWFHSWMISLCVCLKKDAGMRLIQNGKVSGHCSERPINELINASSLKRGCQPPLALLFNTCYCFHGNWYSHPRPHINIQLYLI